MDTGSSLSVQRAEGFIKQVFQERQSRGIDGCDQDTATAGGLLLQEIEEGGDVAFAKDLLERIYRGQMRAELLAEEDVDEDRAAIAVNYGNHVGDFIFSFVCPTPSGVSAEADS